MRYRHLFFDLDHTLWDHERNSRKALRLLHKEHSLSELEIGEEPFLKIYKRVNHYLWDLINKKEINKDGLREKRFALVLKEFGIERKQLSKTLEYEYIAICSRGTYLMPNAIETLLSLREHFELHVITNGFLESQQSKMKASGLNEFFEIVIIADEYKVYKPDPLLFEHALGKAGAEKSESIYIGDNPKVDVLGAHNAGWHSVFYNPEEREGNGKETYEIKDLSELPGLFGLNKQS